MTPKNTYHVLNYIRFAILAVIIVFMAIFHIDGHSYVFDCEGPSGEAMQAERDHENRENERAYERCLERDRENREHADSPNKDDSRDRERADRYLRDNVV